jgi:hypothetical protein
LLGMILHATSARRTPARSPAIATRSVTSDAVCRAREPRHEGRDCQQCTQLAPTQRARLRPRDDARRAQVVTHAQQRAGRAHRAAASSTRAAASSTRRRRLP